MGCCLCCEDKGSKRPRMTDLVTSCSEALDPVEIATGLTAHDRRLIKEIGDIVFNKMHLENKGVAFLISFFKAYPQDQKFFKAFRNIPPDELISLPHLGNHGRRVMDQMSTLIQHLDDPSFLTEQIKGLSHRHRPRKVGTRQFKDMLTMFIVFIREELGSKFTDHHDVAWTKLISHFLSIAEDERSNGKYRINCENECRNGDLPHKEASLDEEEKNNGKNENYGTGDTDEGEKIPARAIEKDDISGR